MFVLLYDSSRHEFTFSLSFSIDCMCLLMLLDHVYDVYVLAGVLSLPRYVVMHLLNIRA